MAGTGSDGGAATLLTQLVAPPRVADPNELKLWMAEALPGVKRLGDSVVMRGYEFADEQLLPHRAEKYPSRFAVLLESPDLDSVAPLLNQVADGQEQDARGAALAVFEQFFETTTPTALPEGAEPPRLESRPTGGPGVFLAWTRPVSAAAEDDYNAWYNDWHCPETLHMEGFVRGRRFRRLPELTADIGIQDIDAPYLTLYDVDNVGAIPFARDVLVPWLSEVGVDHLGPESYDRSFTQAFIFAELEGLDR